MFRTVNVLAPKKKRTRSREALRQRKRDGQRGREREGAKCRWFRRLQNESKRIPFMLSFHERSQVTIPRLRRSRNEISFASPRGTARFKGAHGGAFLLFLRRLFLLSIAQPVASSNFLFVSRRTLGRDTPRGSLPERFRHGTILFRPFPVPTSRIFCKGLLDILFNLLSRSYVQCF